jgi:hypothetical protein
MLGSVHILLTEGREYNYSKTEAYKLKYRSIWHLKHIVVSKIIIYYESILHNGSSMTSKLYCKSILF